MQLLLLNPTLAVSVRHALVKIEKRAPRRTAALPASPTQLQLDKFAA